MAGLSEAPKGQYAPSVCSDNGQPWAAITTTPACARAQLETNWEVKVACFFH